MQDPPTSPEILKSVIAFLRDTALGKLEGHDAFQMRVAVAALELVRRELMLVPASDAAEHTRLKALLGRDGLLADLNRDLADKIAAGEIDLASAALKEHLWATTIEKVAVDQPGYASFRRVLERRGAAEGP